MKNNKNNNQEPRKITIHEGHKLPVTRRDFLRYGIIPFAGHLMMPSLLSQIVFRATSLAAECGNDSGTGYVPFLVFDMAGGAALPGNFLVGKDSDAKDIDMIKDYSSLGWDPKGNNAIDRRFGLPMAGNNISRMLAGISNTASAQALANLRMGSILHFSADDTSQNRSSSLSLVSRAGLKGKFRDGGIGSNNSMSGGNSDVALQETAYKTLFVQNTLDVQGSVGAGPAFENYSDDEIRKLSKIISAMSNAQLAAFNTLPDAKKLQELASCGYEKMMVYGKKISELDPNSDNITRSVYQLNGGEQSIQGTIAHNVISGNTGPGAIVITDCDYHDSNSIKGDQRDQQCGEAIGRAVELAYRKKTPLFFQLITDGGCSSAPGTRNWTSDSNTRSMSVIGYFNPSKAPEQRRLQIGSYTDGGVVNQQAKVGSVQIGDDPIKAANVVLANYLSVCGKLGDFQNFGTLNLRGKDLDSAIIFG